MICQKCGKTLPSDASFCSECGVAMVASSVKNAPTSDNAKQSANQSSNKRNLRPFVQIAIISVLSVCILAVGFFALARQSTAVQDLLWDASVTLNDAAWALRDNSEPLPEIETDPAVIAAIAGVYEVTREYVSHEGYEITFNRERSRGTVYTFFKDGTIRETFSGGEVTMTDAPWAARRINFEDLPELTNMDRMKDIDEWADADWYQIYIYISVPDEWSGARRFLALTDDGDAVFFNPFPGITINEFMARIE